MEQMAEALDDGDDGTADGLLGAGGIESVEVTSDMVNNQFNQTMDMNAFVSGETVSLEKFLDFIEAIEPEEKTQYCYDIQFMCTLSTACRALIGKS